MGGKSRSVSNTTQQAFDQRSYTTINNNQRYDIDNSVRYDIRNDIDNSVRNEYQIDNSVRNDYDIDNSTTIEDSYNTTVEAGGIYVETGGNVTVQETDHDAIASALGFAEEAQDRAFDFAEDFAAKNTALSKTALEEAFKSTVGGLEEQQQTTNKLLVGASALALLASGVAVFAR